MLTVTRHGVRLHFDDQGFVDTPYVYQPLHRGQVYEEGFLNHVRALARSGVYVDVGAHLGTHTLWFAALCQSTHVHAFEPVGRFAEVVRRNVTANGMDAKVTVHQVGLSDTKGHATNELSREHQIGFMADATAASEDFPIVRLDDVLRREPVAVMKLDVEGMEGSVLRGARRLLERWRPVVYAEAHSDQAFDEIRQVLAEHGYKPTGKVFNASPTYEFAAPPRTSFARRLWRRLPPPVRRPIGRALRRLRQS
jgi:FkbM family methyltransferase